MRYEKYAEHDFEHGCMGVFLASGRSRRREIDKFTRTLATPQSTEQQDVPEDQLLKTIEGSKPVGRCISRQYAGSLCSGVL